MRESAVLALAAKALKKAEEIKTLAKGDRGEPGARGPIGLRGAPGAKGDSIIGPAGPQGNKGDRGQQGLEGVAGLSGLKGDLGLDGWTPTMAVVEDRDRRVLKVTGWTGGTGTAPEAGLYLGKRGFVRDIQDATDIRGPRGVDGLSTTGGGRMGGGFPVVGPPGPPGAAGRSIVHAAIDTGGNLIIDYSDGTQEDAGNVEGGDMQEVFVDEQPDIPYPAVSFSQLSGFPGLYLQSVNVP